MAHLLIVYEVRIANEPFRIIMPRFNNVLSFLFLTFFFVSCQNNNDRFYLRGIVPFTLNGQKVILFTYLPNGEVRTSEYAWVKNGEFKFEGYEDLGDRAFISFEDGTWVAVFLERGTININTRDTFFVGGTKQNDIWQTYSDSIMTRNHELTRNLIVENQSKLVSQIIFAHHTITLSTDELESLISRLDPEFMEVPRIVSAVEKNRENNRRFAKWNSLIGKQIEDIVIINLNGQNERLLQHISKSDYTYISIWASWCTPCIAQFPELKKLHESLEKDAVQVIGISIDESKSEWIDAVDRHNIKAWTQLFVREEDRTQLREMFAKIWIPHGVLLNRKGKILSVAISPSDVGVLLKN